MGQEEFYSSRQIQLVFDQNKKVKSSDYEELWKCFPICSLGYVVGSGT